MSEFRSVHRINDIEMYVIANRLIASVHDFMHSNRAAVERIKLSPLLGVLAHEGPEAIIDYVKPKQGKEKKYSPKWAAIGFADNGFPDSVLTVRPNAELELGSRNEPKVLRCTLVDVVSVSSDSERILEGAKTVVEVSRASYGRAEPIVAVDKIPKRLINERQRWLRSDQSIDLFPEISHEEVALRLALGKTAFVGNIRRDDKNGLFEKSHFGTVFSDKEIPALTGI